MRVIKFLARLKARQARGGSWVQVVINILGIATMVKVYQDWFESLGIVLTTMLAFGVFGYLFGTALLGYLDEQYGVWQHENEYNSGLNPFWRHVKGEIASIKATVEDINKQLKSGGKE